MTNLVVTSKPMMGMVDNTKGSAKNRAKCVAAHSYNNLMTAAKVATVAGGTYVLAKHPEKVAEYALKAKNTATPYLQKLASSTLAQKVVSLLKKAKASSLGQKAVSLLSQAMTKAKPFLKDLLGDLTKGGTAVANFAKAHPALAAGAAILLTVIGLNHAFKAGQIDQKYTDKAKYENA